MYTSTYYTYMYIRVRDVESTRFEKKSAAILLGTSTLYAPIEKRGGKKKKKGKRTEKYKNVEELN